MRRQEELYELVGHLLVPWMTGLDFKAEVYWYLAAATILSCKAMAGVASALLRCRCRLGCDTPSRWRSRSSKEYQYQDPVTFFKELYKFRFSSPGADAWGGSRQARFLPLRFQDELLDLGSSSGSLVRCRSTRGVDNAMYPPI